MSDQTLLALLDEVHLSGAQPPQNTIAKRLSVRGRRFPFV